MRRARRLKSLPGPRGAGAGGSGVRYDGIMPNGDRAAAVNAPALDYLSSADGRRRRHFWASARFSRWHGWVALAAWLAFSVLTLFIVMNALDRAGDRPRTVAATTAATVLGPMTGAVSRDFQGCCLKFSLALLPWCLGGLVAGVATQIVVPPRGRLTGAVRVVAWVAGLVVWFGGGIVSFGHALS